MLSRCLRVLVLIGFCLWLAPVMAVAQSSSASQDLPSPVKVISERPWEIGVFYPFQYYQTQNDIGKSNAFTAVGLGVIATRSFYRGIGIMASYQADINAVTSAAIFTGLNVGVNFVLLGNDSVVHDSSSFSMRSYPLFRSSVSLGVGQRNYDFRTLIAKEQIDRVAAGRKVNVELEGSGWAPFGRLQIDGRLFGLSRIGGFLQYQVMLPNSVQKTRVVSYFAGLSYDFSRLSGTVE